MMRPFRRGGATIVGESLRDSSRRVAVEAFGLGLLVVDPDQRIIEANDLARAHLLLPEAGRTPQAAPPQILRLLASGETAGEFTVRIDQKTTRRYESRIAPVPGDDSSTVVVIREATELRDVHDRLQRLAYRDELTGLSNRRHLVEQLAELIEASHSRNVEFALLYIDLDRFKEMNDTLGHSAGDQLLRSLAHRLRQQIMSGSIFANSGLQSVRAEVARLGGDEFALLLEGTQSREDAARVADALLQVIAEPIWIDEQHVTNSASVGIATFPQDGASGELLLRNADAALYQAKRSGRNRFEFYDLSFDAQGRRKSEIRTRLRHAIENGELHLHYQPKIDLSSGAVVGAEALLRWENPELGRVGPAEFIPIAESSNLIPAIGAWVLDEACRQQREWVVAGLTAVPVAVNVSGHQVAETGFELGVANAMRLHEIDPRLIEIELTESSLLDDSDTTMLCLHSLRAMGVKLSLDDFGTGYAALGYLTRLPLDVLKLDRTLIRDVDTDPAAERVVKATVSMAHALGLCVVAEGLDRQDHATVLAELGCDQGQGFLFHPALPPAEFAQLLRDAGKTIQRKPAESVAARTNAAARAEERACSPARAATALSNTNDGSLETIRYTLIVDDEHGILGPVALALTRLGVLTLYTAFADEASLLASQEPGLIRAIMVTPFTPMGPLTDTISRIGGQLDGGRVSLVVVSETEHASEGRACARKLGASWVVSLPVSDNDLRFVVNSATALPSELASRSDPRAPVELGASLYWSDRQAVGSIVSLSEGGVFVEQDELLEVGVHVRVGFQLGEDLIDAEGHVVYANLRGTSMSPALPGGIGVAFMGLDPDYRSAIQEVVKAKIARFAP